MKHRLQQKKRQTNRRQSDWAKAVRIVREAEARESGGSWEGRTGLRHVGRVGRGLETPAVRRAEEAIPSGARQKAQESEVQTAEPVPQSPQRGKAGRAEPAELAFATKEQSRKWSVPQLNHRVFDRWNGWTIRACARWTE
jgi:hypothetical protein